MSGIPEPFQLNISGTTATDGAQALAIVNYGSLSVPDVGSRRKPDDLLDRLPYAVEAHFNAYNKQHDPTCLPETRIDLLQEIYSWADGNNEPFIFWLNGLAGTGKSTIARTVARKYFEQHQLGASFFFSRGGGDVGRADKFVTTIARQLASSIPSFQRAISEAIIERSDIASHALSDQWRQLILRPLCQLPSDSCPSSYILVIDALDECDGDKNIGIILQLLAEARLLKTVRLRLFLTSRPETPIQNGFYHIPGAEHQDFVLHNISSSIINHDIAIFLEHNLRRTRTAFHLPSGWPSEQEIAALGKNASGLFIWAATACRFIHAGKRFAADRLSLVLKRRAPVDDTEEDYSTDDSVASNGDCMISPEEKLNEIYLAVLQNSVRNYTKDERKRWYKLLRDATGTIILLFLPLSAISLARFLNVHEEYIIQTLNDLHSILNIPEVQVLPIRLHHPSFRDFLLDKSRCGSSKFWVDEKQAHCRLADSCIRLMSTALKEDICGVHVPGTLATDVERNQVDQYLPPEIQYSCLYWIQHLQRSDAQLRDNDYVHQFLQEHLLHWLEALSWMQKMPEGILDIISLESIALTADYHGLYAFIHDIKRFALHNRAVIEQAPLQAYCSALLFTPVESIVRRHFSGKMPWWIKRGPEMEKNWSAMLQILEGHSGSVNAVTFSPDGKQLASGSWDHTIRLWDAATGAMLQTLEGHSGYISAVAFSPDGKQLASGSDDETIRLWDAATGAMLQTLEVDTAVSTLSFSNDGSIMTDHGRLDAMPLRNSFVPPSSVPPSHPLSLLQPVPSPSFRPRIFVRDEWIVHGENRMLWLPPDYRPSCSAVHDGVVCMGHRSGRVSIFELEFSSTFSSTTSPPTSYAGTALSIHNG